MKKVTAAAVTAAASLGAGGIAFGVTHEFAGHLDYSRSRVNAGVEACAKHLGKTLVKSSVVPPDCGGYLKSETTEVDLYDPSSDTSQEVSSKTVYILPPHDVFLTANLETLEQAKRDARANTDLEYATGGFSALMIGAMCTILFSSERRRAAREAAAVDAINARSL